MEMQKLFRGRLIDHVQIVTADLATSRRFYEAVLDVLGVSIDFEDVGMFGAEQLFRPVDGECLGDIDELAASVVPLARIAFRVFVREHAASRFEDGRADEILGRDELEPFFLPLKFVLNRLCNFGINLGERCHRGAWSMAVILLMRRS